MRSLENDHAGTRFEVAIRRGAEIEIARAGLARAVGGFIERRGARGQHALDIRGQRAAVLLHALGRLAETERVPGFERAELKGESPAHGAVDLDDAVGNLGNHLRRIEEEIAVKAPEELADAIRSGNQRAQALRQIFDNTHRFGGGELHLLRGMILERLAIDGVDLFLGAFADALVESLSALLAEPAALDHALHEIGDDEALARGIVRHKLVQIAQNVRPHVEADDVDQGGSSRSWAIRSAGPVMASISSTVKSPSTVSLWMVEPKKQPRRLAMKFGVSLHGTAPLPRCRSQNSETQRKTSGAVSGPGIISTRCR